MKMATKLLAGTANYNWTIGNVNFHFRRSQIRKKEKNTGGALAPLKLWPMDS